MLTDVTVMYDGSCKVAFAIVWTILVPVEVFSDMVNFSSMRVVWRCEIKIS